LNKLIKKDVLSILAKVGKKSAEIGCNSASLFGFHQPKEPKDINTMLKKCK
jgi:cyclic lactone autoinducer peptide